LLNVEAAQVSALTEDGATESDPEGPTPVDLVVLGSGVGGLTAALAAALKGLRAVVLEHSDRIGGTSARSSGTVWVPGNHYLRTHGVTGDGEDAARYLASLVGERGDPEIWRAFLAGAPSMLLDLEQRAGLAFRPYMTAPDYRQDHPGAAKGGRALEPMPFDGRKLGFDFGRLAWPIPELMVFGGMMVTRGEAAQLVRADRSPKGFALGAQLLARYLRDRLGYARGTRLVLGNALVARLLKAVLDRGVPVLTGVRTQRLVVTGGRVGGVEATVNGARRTIAARCGIVLAGGGFPANAALRAQYLPAPVAEFTPAGPTCDGSTIALGLAAGAALGPSGLDNALWFPSSTMTRGDGTTAVYPHIVLDRAKPGLIAVNGAGKRFVNEAVSYHEFVRAMYRAHADTPAIPAWLVCDRAFIRRYGLGLIRPRTPSLRKYVAGGYLREGSTIAALADAIGVPAATLQATVARFNGFAAAGADADFGKGSTIYERANGDPGIAPNPCLGPIARPPFYAVPVLPTPLGTSLGLRADVHARACDADGRPIPGLYVCGNDMQSAFGGEYPGAGAQLGQAMTFGWIAARHAASAASDGVRPLTQTVAVESTRLVARGVTPATNKG
jgi:succinate dehydrogenase/fumarate reductase flavoprotein subunit